MEKNRTRITILGEDFLIRTDKSSEYLEKIIELLNSKIDKIREMTGIQSPLRTAILAGLLMAEEKMENSPARPGYEDDEEISAITARLISDLDDLIKH